MTKTVLTILFSAGFTVSCCYAAGRVLFQLLAIRLYRQEERVLAFLAGAPLVSSLVFAAAAAGLVYKGVLLAAGLLILAGATWRGAWRLPDDRLPPLPRFWQILFCVVFAVFAVFYFVHALAPEASPDGSTYHLGLVSQYQRQRGFGRITTNMYANLSQGAEMLFLFAFCFGRHSAAALTHCAFLVALPLAMLAYGQRRGAPIAGGCGALLTFLAPVAGAAGASAYNDVAAACVVFSVFWLLELWDITGNPALLAPAGLLAGFAYAVKYTAFLAVPYALGYIAWRNWRGHRPLWPALRTVSLCAAPLILPWMAKNWIVVGNPLSPFFNRLFPNPYVHISIEESYRAGMRHLGDLAHVWQIPWEVTVAGGSLQGLIGPAFLLAPIALAALRYSAGRRLLAAAIIFLLPFFSNRGTRFLLPMLPFLSLAMGLAAARARGMAALLVLVHAALCLPPSISKYANAYAWRLADFPWRAALRLQSEDEYLTRNLGGYVIARLIDQTVPPDGRVLAFSAPAEAYTRRQILNSYQAALNNTLTDILYAAFDEGYQPTRRIRFRFPRQNFGAVRVSVKSRIAGAGEQPEWTVNELRLYRGQQEVARRPGWRLRARPNAWEIDQAFDNSPVTRWRSWQEIFPGMFVEVELGTPEAADSVVLECARDQSSVPLRLEGLGASGSWVTLSETPAEEFFVPTPAWLRRAATAELKLRGVRYLLVSDNDIGAADFSLRSKAWGITLIGRRGESALYRID